MFKSDGQLQIATIYLERTSINFKPTSVFVFQVRETMCYPKLLLDRPQGVHQEEAAPSAPTCACVDSTTKAGIRPHPRQLVTIIGYIRDHHRDGNAYNKRVQT